MPKKRNGTAIDGVAMGVLAIVCGVIVLVYPGLLRWIVGVYLIVVGVLAISRRR